MISSPFTIYSEFGPKEILDIKQSHILCNSGEKYFLKSVYDFLSERYITDNKDINFKTMCLYGKDNMFEYFDINKQIPELPKNTKNNYEDDKNLY